MPYELHEFDSWLIDKIEKRTQKFQRNTGKDCFWLARFSLILFAISFVVFVAGAVWYVYPSKDWWLYILMLSFPGVIRILWPAIRKAEEAAYKHLEKGLANPQKLALADIRLLYHIFPILFCFVLFMIAAPAFLVPFWLSILVPVGGELLTLSVYLVSCDSLRPAKSKVREWLEKFVSATKELLSPAPQPVPVEVPSP